MSSSEFYDNFLTYQISSGINDRIHGLYKRLRRHGFRSDSTVLEIGCGIGTMTYLLKKRIKSGSIEAIDLSERSIEYAEKNIKAPNLFFSATDILDYESRLPTFDFVLLFDVIEHIPLGEHPALFEKISGWMDVSSLMLINIPNPDYILFEQKNNPGALQEIDQPVHTHRLMEVFHHLKLEVIQLETYSVWVKNDYRFFLVRKQQDFREELMSEKRNFFQKAMTWFRRRWRKLTYRYPTKPYY